MMNDDIKPKTKLVMHADDFGLSFGFNQGILRAYQEGWLTSTCVRVNGPAYQNAIEEILPQIPDVGMGLHLNIVEGKSLRSFKKTNSSIVDIDYNFNCNFGELILKSASREILREIEDEFRDQIERALKHLPQIDHLNSHQHSHAIPAIFEIVCKLADEYGIGHVRLPKERMYIEDRKILSARPWFVANILKNRILNLFGTHNLKTAHRYNIKTNDFLIGILYTQYMNKDRFLAGLKAHAKKYETQNIEVLFHPVVILGTKLEKYIDRDVRNYIINLARHEELQTLMDKNLFDKSWLNKIQLTNYKLLGLSHCGAGGKLENHVTKNIAEGSNQTPQLKALIVLDEVTFHHPKLLKWLATRCHHINVLEVIIVTLPKGGKLSKYLLRNWFNLGVWQFLLLGAKKVTFDFFGRLPIPVRGDFDSSVERVALRLRLKFQHISSLDDRKFRTHVRQIQPDVIYSSNSLFFDTEFRSYAKRCCINRHSAPLPSYGGILPIFRALQFGESFIGASVHEMESEMDAGRVLSRKWCPIMGGDTLDKLYDISFTLSAVASDETFRKLRFHEKTVDPEGETLPKSYFSYPENEDWEEFRNRKGRFI